MASQRPICYPTSDGKPLGGTDVQRDLTLYLIAALKTHFADKQYVYVSGNNFVFWEEGNPKARISPDTYVVFGAEMRLRDSYMAWKEGDLLPNVVFEVTSRKTQREDVESKLPLYERTLQTPEYFLFDPTPEYFLFDPTGDYLRPRLQGYRLADGRYVRLELVNGRLHSEQLGLDLVQDDETLRLFDPVKNRFLPDFLEQAQQIETTKAELVRLRAEIETLTAKRRKEGVE